MRNYWLVLMCLISLLVGCAERPLEPVIEKEPSFYELNEKPLDFIVGSKDAGFFSALISYCWNADINACNLQVVDPTEELLGLKTHVVKPGEKIYFNFFLDPSSKAPSPTSAKLFRFIDDTATEVDLNPDGTYSAPNEEGKYKYGYLVQFDSDIKGQAYYGFQMFVR